MSDDDRPRISPCPPRVSIATTAPIDRDGWPVFGGHIGARAALSRARLLAAAAGGTPREMPIGKKIAEALREIRDETARKVRLAEFAEKMTPEKRRRVEASLAEFTAAVDAVADKMEGGTDDE